MSINKKISIVLSVFLFLLGMAGCGTQTTPIASSIPQSKIPEPYTLMLKQLEFNDLNMAQKYADLVISDFKDSDYVYNAELVKNIVNLSKMCVVRMKSNYIIAGSAKMGSLNSKDDIDKMQGYIKNLQGESELYEPIYNGTTQYLLDHFSDKDKVQLKLPTIPSNMSFADYSSLKFFSAVGYPIPTDSEMTTGDKQNTLAWFFLTTKDYTNGSKFYPDYFYYLSINTDDTAMKKKLLNKIIELTESDKYNEIRIKAQEDLTKLK